MVNLSAVTLLVEVDSYYRLLEISGFDERQTGIY